MFSKIISLVTDASDAAVSLAPERHKSPKITFGHESPIPRGMTPVSSDPGFQRSSLVVRDPFIAA